MKGMKKIKIEGKRLLDWTLNGVLAVFGLGALGLFLQVFVFSSFKIPTGSMEPELWPGDNLLVCKPLLGARLFDVAAALGDEQTEIYRVPGFRKIRRNDVLVFNYPYPNRKDRMEMHILKYYVKRCIGLPGDTLSIRDGRFHIAGYAGPLGNRAAQEKIGRLEKGAFSPGVYRSYPYDSLLDWNIRDFGPLYIPKAGDSVRLDRDRYVLYHRLIEWEQKGTWTYRDSTVYCNERPVEGYRFRKNYYFMAGDRGENSRDSRYWGLLPEEYIVGKAWVIWKSTDPLTGKFRRDRFLKRIH